MESVSIGVDCSKAPPPPFAVSLARGLSILLLIECSAAAYAHAGAIVVAPDGSGDAPTIQAAVNMAANGDVVLLTSGTFTGPGNRDVNFLGKVITVMSQSGAASTLIDCQNLGRGFLFQFGEGPSSALVGVTITGGRGTGVGASGGAVLCLAASPTIEDCVFNNNDITPDDGDGAAIACIAGAQPLIRRNQFISNFGDQGGAIYASSGARPFIVENSFEFNSGNEGGAIYADQDAFLTIDDNHFHDNTADVRGGAMCLSSAGGLIENSSFSHSASVAGAVIFWEGSTLAGASTIRRNTMSENRSTGGQGVLVLNTTVAVQRNVIAFSEEGSATSCTAGATFSCNIVFGNAGGDAICGTDGGNNLAVDPKFCGVLATHDYRLRSDSPCIPANNACGQLIGSESVDCSDMTPARRATWGEIKARYR